MQFLFLIANTHTIISFGFCNVPRTRSEMKNATYSKGVYFEAGSNSFEDPSTSLHIRSNSSTTPLRLFKAICFSPWILPVQKRPQNLNIYNTNCIAWFRSRVQICIGFFNNRNIQIQIYKNTKMGFGTAY